MNANTPEQLVAVAVEDTIATITLTRPAKRNALSLRVVEQLRVAFDALPDTVRVAILAGEGEHFCAGLDQIGRAHV